MGVIDILPKCVSSVYFIYDETWERFSLGKVRLVVVLYEIKLPFFPSWVPYGRFLSEERSDKLVYLQWRHYTWVRLSFTLCVLFNFSFSVLGFYIYSCPKMRYKGEYSPSYLADPVRSDHAHLKNELLMHRFWTGNLWVVSFTILHSTTRKAPLCLFL